MPASLPQNVNNHYERAEKATLMAVRSYFNVMGLTRDAADRPVTIPNYFNKKYIGEDPQFPVYDPVLARTVHFMPRIPEYFIKDIGFKDTKLRGDYNVRPLESYAGLFLSHPMHDIIQQRKNPHGVKMAVSVVDILRDQRPNILHHGVKRHNNLPPRIERDTAEAAYYLDCVLAHVSTSKLPKIKIDRLQHAIIQNKTDMAVMMASFVDLAYDVLQLKPSR